MFEIEHAHARELDRFLAEVRASDRIVYDYALETLRMFLDAAPEILANVIRDRVAEMIAGVAEASGKGAFGTGEKVSIRERECIQRIDVALDLRSSTGARSALDRICAPGHAPASGHGASQIAKTSDTMPVP